MAADIQASEMAKVPRKRKSKHSNKPSMMRKKSKGEFYQVPKAKGLNSRKMKMLFKKRAKDYNSDDDEDDRGAGDLAAQPLDDGEEQEASDSGKVHGHGGADDSDVGSEHGDEGNADFEDDGSQHELTKFTEGCRAFRIAFLKIMKKNISKDPLGPVLSGQKKLIAEKLAQEEAEKKVKAEAKKEKRLSPVGDNIQVNKAQYAQKGLNPARSKDAKVLGKQRKEAFLSGLQKSSNGTMPFKSPNAAKVFLGNDLLSVGEVEDQDLSSQGNSEKEDIPYVLGTKSVQVDNDEPGWAPLRNDYMLTDAKLKDWDKMADNPGSLVPEEMPLTDSSSDDE
ncbi:hypothetical protein ACLOJK_035495 [Asimina triloba]